MPILGKNGGYIFTPADDQRMYKIFHEAVLSLIKNIQNNEMPDGGFCIRGAANFLKGISRGTIPRFAKNAAKKLLRNKSIQIEKIVDSEQALKKAKDLKDESKRLRDWFKMASESLYSMDESVRNGKIPNDTNLVLPEIANIFDSLSRGITPNSIKDAAKNGRRCVDEQIDLLTDCALIYREAVKNGIVIDNKPTKSIADAYGVTSKTVRKWRKDDFMSICYPILRKHTRTEAEWKSILTCWGEHYKGTREFRSNFNSLKKMFREKKPFAKILLEIKKINAKNPFYPVEFDEEKGQVWINSSASHRSKKKPI